MNCEHNNEKQLDKHGYIHKCLDCKKYSELYNNNNQTCLRYVNTIEEILINRYQKRIEKLMSESKQLDIFTSHKNLKYYRENKKDITARIEELLQVVKDMEELIK